MVLFSFLSGFILSLWGSLFIMVKLRPEKYQRSIGPAPAASDSSLFDSHDNDTESDNFADFDEFTSSCEIHNRRLDASIDKDVKEGFIGLDYFDSQSLYGLMNTWMVQNPTVSVVFTDDLRSVMTEYGDLFLLVSLLSIILAVAIGIRARFCTLNLMQIQQGDDSEFEDVPFNSPTPMPPFNFETSMDFTEVKCSSFSPLCDDILESPAALIGELKPAIYDVSLESSPLNLSFLSDDLETTIGLTEDERNLVDPFTLNPLDELELLALGASAGASIAVKRNPYLEQQPSVEDTSRGKLSVDLELTSLNNIHKHPDDECEIDEISRKPLSILESVQSDNRISHHKAIKKGIVSENNEHLAEILSNDNSLVAVLRSDTNAETDNAFTLVLDPTPGILPTIQSEIANHLLLPQQTDHEAVPMPSDNEESDEVENYKAVQAGDKAVKSAPKESGISKPHPPTVGSGSSTSLSTSQLTALFAPPSRTLQRLETIIEDAKNEEEDSIDMLKPITSNSNCGHLNTAVFVSGPNSPLIGPTLTESPNAHELLPNKDGSGDIELSTTATETPSSKLQNCDTISPLYSSGNALCCGIEDTDIILQAPQIASNNSVSLLDVVDITRNYTSDQFIDCSFYNPTAPEKLPRKESILQKVFRDPKDSTIHFTSPSKIPIPASPLKGFSSSNLIKGSPRPLSLQTLNIDSRIRSLLQEIKICDSNDVFRLMEDCLEQLFGPDPDVSIDEEYVEDFALDEIDEALRLFDEPETSENWKERSNMLDIFIIHLRTRLPAKYSSYFSEKIGIYLDCILNIVSTQRTILLAKVIVFLKEYIYRADQLASAEDVFRSIIHQIIPLTRTSQTSRHIGNLAIKSLCLIIQSINPESFIAVFDSLFDRFLQDKKLKGEKFTCLFMIKFYIINNLKNFESAIDDYPGQIDQIISKLNVYISELCIDGYQKTRKEIVEIYLVLLDVSPHSEFVEDYYNKLSRYMKGRVPPPGQKHASL